MIAAGEPGTALRVVHVVLPGDVDDPAAPSGGNRYDRRVCQELTAHGWAVRELPVPGAWPHPGPVEQAALAAALAAVPDDALVLLDGLVACAAPEVVVPQAGRLRLTVLVHLPLADETGLTPDEAARLNARERVSLRAATAVVVTSGAARRRLIDRHGLNPAIVHVVAPGVDPAPPATGTDGASQLLCVAALTPRKGHDVLVRALAEVADRPWRCDFVGALDRAPGYVDRVRRLIEAAGLPDRVWLVGPRTGVELSASYAAADLVVLASRAETYGMVVTEALACGIPVLATTVDGVPEALGHAGDGTRPGLLVAPDDPGALAGALRRWLSGPELRDRLRASAADRRQFLPGWAATADRLAGVMRGQRPAGRAG